MRAFLTAYVDSEIVLQTVETFHPRGAETSVTGMLLAVGDTLIRLRTALGVQHVALQQIVAFRPRDPSRLPKAIGDLKGPATKTEVLEWVDDVNAAIKARKPEAEVRVLLGRVIHAATRLLAKHEDAQLAVAKERAEVILKKCTDPSLPPEE